MPVNSADDKWDPRNAPFGTPLAFPDPKNAYPSAADDRALPPPVGGVHTLIEQTAPAAPPADCANLWIEDNGSGKTRLMVQFATGAAVQLAIQP
jgi:hypothetical protein